MSRGAEDYTTTFKVLDDQLDNLDDLDWRLKARQEKQNRPSNEQTAPQPSASAKLGGRAPSVAKRQKRERTEAKPTVVRREVRRNLTLKIREETEEKFNRLFYELRLAGDSRKKQDLAEEAFELLLKKYRNHLA
ncbi:MAG: hypothetical protein AAFX06_26455 [Planctomycetota bacterium]